MHFREGAGNPEKMRRSNSSGDEKIDAALSVIDSFLGGNSNTTTNNDIGWLSGSGTDAKSLISQNNVLKAGMVLLRKKNSEVVVCASLFSVINFV